MSKRNSIILGLLFVIVVVEIIILAPKEIGTPSEPTLASKSSTGPQAGSGSGSGNVFGNQQTGEAMQGIYSVEAQKTGKEWELWADQALHPKTEQEWTIGNVRVKFYAKSGVVYTVTGKQGQVVPNDKGIRDIKISGNVVTRSSNGYTFKSESMFYDSQAKRLTSPTEVEMTSAADKEGGELKLTGVDMLADFATNEIRINKNVRAKKGIKNNKIAHIRSDRALFSGISNMANFTGNVEINVDDMKIAGPEAKFAYDPKLQSLASVLVGGGVRVSDRDKVATSETVAVDFKDDKVVFKGSPRVVQNGDELTGDEIIFIDGGKKVQVVNAKAQLDPNSVEKSQQSGGWQNPLENKN